jgi:phosphate transport system substrate-binding protein
MKNVKVSIFFSQLAIFLFAIFISNCNHPKLPSQQNQELKGNIFISGSFAMYPIVAKWANEFSKLHPNVRIDLSAGGAGKGMTDLHSGKVDIAMYSTLLSKDDLSKGAFPITVACDAVVPIVSASNPFLKNILTNGIDREKFNKIFISNEIAIWSEVFDIQSTNPVNVYTRSDSCGAAEVWAKYLGYSQKNLRGRMVFGDKGIIDAVKKDSFGLGYVNLAHAFNPATSKQNDGFFIVPIDLNGNGVIGPDESFYDSFTNLKGAIKKGVFPTPPARNLFLVTKGKPQSPIVIAFIKFALTQGQNWVDSTGYIELLDNQIADELVRIE